LNTGGKKRVSGRGEFSQQAQLRDRSGLTTPKKKNLTTGLEGHRKSGTRERPGINRSVDSLKKEKRQWERDQGGEKEL